MADEKDEMTENAPVEETPVIDEAEAVVEEAPVAEAAADEATEPEAVAEQVEQVAADEAEPVVEQPEGDDASAEAAPAAAVAEEAASETVAPPPSGPKPKKKRLPRAQRPAKTRAKRQRAAERKPIVRLPKPEHERGRSAERQGTVVSSGMDKTIVVKVDVIKSHPKYKKVVRRSTKFHAHDEGNSAKVGDVVRIVETRPLSKTKRWRLAEIVEVAK